MEPALCYPLRMAKRPKPKPLYIGPWIRFVGKKQVEIARAAGITDGYLSNLIAGDRVNPSLDLIIRVADAIGVPVQALSSPPPPSGGPGPDLTPSEAALVAMLRAQKPRK